MLTPMKVQNVNAALRAGNLSVNLAGAVSRAQDKCAVSGH
jgi:hypothetical protein